MEQFDTDREQMIARAREAGVETIVAIGSGTGPGSLDCGIRLAEQHEFIYATIGIHPMRPSWPRTPIFRSWNNWRNGPR